MNKPTISIIVPIYNVEQYLEQCIESIVTQEEALKRIEVILVNDCSPDRAGDIAEKYSNEYDFVKYICHETNQGLSIARNTGISAAKGDWLWFIDSDDWIEQGSLNTLLKMIEDNHTCDIICIQKKNISQGWSRINDVIPHSLCMSGKQYLQSFLQKSVPPKFIVKHQFLLDNNLFFYPHLLHEDVLHCYTMLYCADKVFVSEKPLYIKRCVRSGSIMNSLTEKNAHDLIVVHKQLMDFCDHQVLQEDKTWFFKLSFGSIWNAYKYVNRTSGYSLFQKKHKDYVRSICGRAIRHKGFRIKLKALYIRFLPRYIYQIDKVCRVDRKVKSLWKKKSIL